MVAGREIRHPSWRVYKALQDCAARNPDGIFDVTDYGLKDVRVYMPYQGNDDLTDELVNHIENPEYKEDNYGIRQCLDIFLSIEDRRMVESLILNGLSPAELSTTIGCDESVALTYISVFFDTSVFRNHVDKIVYTREGVRGDDLIAKDSAMKNGTSYTKLSVGLGKKDLVIDDLLKDAIAVAYMNFIDRSKDAGVDEQFAAQGWGNVMVKLAQNLNKKGNNSLNIEDLSIILQNSPPPKKSVADLI